MSHRIPTYELTGVRICAPTSVSRPLSAAAATVHAAGLVTFDEADRYTMELTFDGARQGASADLKPGLPLSLRW